MKMIAKKVIKEKVITSSRKFIYEAVGIFYCYMLFLCELFTGTNILALLAIILSIPVTIIIAKKITLERSTIAIFKGDIIELVDLLSREGVTLKSSNNVYIFLSTKFSFTPISCVAKVVDEGIKITTGQYFLEECLANDGRITLINKFGI